MICREELTSVEGFELEFKTTRGRFREEENIEVYAVYGGLKERLLVLKVFHGRPPFYRKWVEVFHVKPRLPVSGGYVEFAGSELEKKLIECLSRFLQGGEWLYVEYDYDAETRTALEHGIPPVLTRLGYMLFKHGFTWFKDWYYPEGFMEGGPKLQAEKPLNDEVRVKHYKEVCREAKESLDKLVVLVSTVKYPWIIANAVERANQILKECSHQSLTP